MTEPRKVYYTAFNLRTDSLTAGGTEKKLLKTVWSSRQTLTGLTCLPEANGGAAWVTAGFGHAPSLGLP